MSDNPKSVSRFSVYRRLWKPAVVTGTGGSVAAIWLDEILIFGEEILALILLPFMAGIIYLLDIFMFKSRMPKRNDLTNRNHKGVKE